MMVMLRGGWRGGQRRIGASVGAADGRGTGVVRDNRQWRKTASLLRNHNRRRKVATIHGAIDEAVDGGRHEMRRSCRHGGEGRCSAHARQASR